MSNVRITTLALGLALSTPAQLAHAQAQPASLAAIDGPTSCPTKAGASKLQTILGVVPGMTVNETLAAFKCAHPKTKFEVTYPGSQPDERNKGPQSVRIQGVTQASEQAAGYELLFAELYGAPGKERVYSITIEIQPPRTANIPGDKMAALMEQRYGPTSDWKYGQRIRTKNFDGKDSVNDANGCPYDFTGYGSTRDLCGLNLKYLVQKMWDTGNVTKYSVTVFRDDLWVQYQKNPG